MNQGENDRGGLGWETLALAIAAVAVVAIGLSTYSGWTVGRANWPSEFGSNGERIYFTGVSESGAPIRSLGGNQHNLMMGGNA